MKNKKSVKSIRFLMKIRQKLKVLKMLFCFHPEEKTFFEWCNENLIFILDIVCLPFQLLFMSKYLLNGRYEISIFFLFACCFCVLSVRFFYIGRLEAYANYLTNSENNIK